MSHWLSPSDLRNKLLHDIVQQQKETDMVLKDMMKALTILNEQIYSMRGEQDEHKDELCCAITMLGIKSPNSSEYNDDIDHPAVGFTPDNRKVSTSEGFTQTRDDYEGATRDKEDYNTEI
jgi:hypothetical protein